jgi:Suppressor of fused protein (SUFU)
VTNEHGTQVVAHYTATWKSPTKSLRLSAGPTDDLPDCFEVLTIQKADGMWAFATKCMSLPQDRHGLEIHILTRSRFSWESELVEVLTVVAHYHRTGRPLGVGHTVNIGRPIVPGSTCTHGLLSLPYLDGPALEWMGDSDVQFLWLIPVTQAEIDFKKREGLEALEARFEAVRFDYADFFRDSVV